MSPIKKSLSRYTSDWSARIEFLKKSLAAEQRITQPSRQFPPDRPIPEQNYRPVEDRAQVLSEQLKMFQEASAHEIRRISKRCQDLEKFVNDKEIDLQNLKSDSVEHRLVHEDLKKMIVEHSKNSPQSLDVIEKNIRDLAEAVKTIQSRIAFLESFSKPAPTPEVAAKKSAFSRWLAWWNEPVAKIPVFKGP